MIYKILHLSDLHIGDRPEILSPIDAHKCTKLDQLRMAPTSHSPIVLDALARFVWAMRDAIDLLLISGDIATSGKEEDLKSARSFLTTQSESWSQNDGSPTIGFLPKSKVAIIPGNHDRYTPKLCMPGNRNFDFLFSDYWWVGQGTQPLKQIEDSDTGERLIIFGTDFSLRSEFHASGPAFSFMGQGRAYRSLIRQMENLLNMFPDSALLLISHFPIEFRKGLPVPLRLRKEYRVLEIAKDFGIEALLCGHTHEEDAYFLGDDDELRVLCTSSACQMGMATHGVHLYELHVSDNSISRVFRTEYRYSERVFSAVTEGIN